MFPVKKNTKTTSVRTDSGSSYISDNWREERVSRQSTFIRTRENGEKTDSQVREYGIRKQSDAESISKDIFKSIF